MAGNLMRVGIIQSSYIPWRGYFDFINSVDLFIIFDDIQYPRGRSWRNRNQLKTRTGLKWLTVPVKPKSYKFAIDQVMIGQTNDNWQNTHRVLLEEALSVAPFFYEAVEIWEKGIVFNDLGLSELNVRLIKQICTYLQITTPIALSRDYNVTGAKTERLIQLLNQVGATTYLSGPTAQDYLDEDLFRKHGIRLEYKNYDYPPYPQLWGDFVGNVTILDLIANTGPAARDYIKSLSPNQVAVE